ncbi:RTA1-domain-containing protein [Aspergillus steynii IBT 23096]|uniref:RTA1-domain-containing protein n=1 Tax=Aspergillus steynii IBT 23096 TaxID=1392250 RepID=A0A2I2GSH1_9EURO|nr:RTA1-domain-containing protein [Aspergillus steynii IBT 23096]PLB55816.1 RTA1-domain-containing protein [Aspergillus steynii IBT 23096]
MITFVLYRYTPSIPAAAVSGAVFLALAVLHGIFILRHRAMFFTAFFIGLLLEAAGYFARIFSHFDTTALGPYIVQTMLILVAPPLFAASIYMTLGRLIVRLGAENESLIPVKYLTKIFVAGDVISFVLQCGGGGYMAAGSLEAMENGETIVIAGLAVQLFIFGVFVLVAAVFHYRVRKLGTYTPLTTFPASWRTSWEYMLYAMYAACLLIFVRSIFRVVEFVQGNAGYIMEREYLLYIFDAILMAVQAVFLLLVYPGKVLNEIHGGGRARLNSDRADSSEVFLQPVKAPSLVGRERQRHRVSHRKSRNGCYTCKARRVKCDELKPTCGACSFREAPCVYPRATSPVRPKLRARRDPDAILRAGSSTGDSRKSVESSQDAPSESVSPRPLDFLAGLSVAPTSGGPRENLPLNMVDLRLLSHFVTNTTKRMSLNPSKRRVWETVFPEYANVIFAHHQIGLGGFRKALSSLSTSNCGEIFVGAMLLVGFAFGSLRVRNRSDVLSASFQSPECPQQLHPRFDWIVLIRGLISVIAKYWPQLRMSPMKDLLHFAHRTDDYQMYPVEMFTTITPPHPETWSPRIARFCAGAYKALQDLKSYAASLGARHSTHDAARPTDPTQPGEQTRLDHILSEQNDTLGVLEQTFMRIMYVAQMTRRPDASTRDTQADLEDAAVMAWPELIPAGFLTSIERPGGGADFSYVIVAHLYLTFTLFEDYWYLKGAFEEDIMKINMLVACSEEDELKSLMEWPLAVILC